MLHVFLAQHRDEILARTRAKLALRESPRVIDEELTNGAPHFMAQLADTLRLSQSVTSLEMNAQAAAHGRDLSRLGFSVSRAVHEYGDVRQAIAELALETNASITGDELRTLNRCLDDASAGAVTAFALTRESAIARTGTERLGFLAHELRNLLASATLSFEIVKMGTVGTGGSTSVALRQALAAMRGLVNRSLGEVRLEAGVEHWERLTVREFLEELALTAALQATAAGHRLTVFGPVDPAVTIEVDRQILASVLSNLLQNAFKFSQPHSTILLHARSTADRVMIDVEDECGGLPPGEAERLFLPFERRGANSAGLGLGLSISREGAKANRGELTVRNVPARGCVFTVDLPRPG